MYDVVVIGQGLSGMLTAIWAKEKGYRTAVVASGSGKMVQSTGLIDLIPGSDGGMKDWMEQFQIDSLSKSQLAGAIQQFKELMQRVGYPYHGDAEALISIATGTGHLKSTALYPETVLPIPEQGRIMIVGFHEISDFQPLYVKGNLQKYRSNLTIETMKIHLGANSQRTLTQLDAARLLDQKEIRDSCIRQIKQQMSEKRMKKPDLLIFPASLGIENWDEAIQQFSTELQAWVTEAPGMPPNATAIRLNERLKKEAVKMGVRFYADTTVTGCRLDGEEIKSLNIQAMNQIRELSASHFILASGGILGGGLELSHDGIKDAVLGLSVNQFGEFINCPVNLQPVGASKGTKVTHYGITGGLFSILSSHEAISKIEQSSLGGTRSA